MFSFFLQAKSAPFVPIDDVYMTGILRGKAGIAIGNHILKVLSSHLN
jgi:hypothetical protein